MCRKALKVKPLSPDHWVIFTPPVDQKLWKRYMEEDDSDSTTTDTEGGSMAGPSTVAKTAQPDSTEAKSKPKNNLVSYSTW